MHPTIFNPKKPITGQILHWGEIYGAATALSIYSAAQNDSALVVVITPDMSSAARLEQEINFFNKDRKLPVFIFPDWETLPYDSFSPHQDIISQRLLTLYKLPTITKGIVIVPITTLIVKIAPREYIEANSLVLKLKDRLDLDVFRKRLQQHGYRVVDQVMEHGEFAIRGSILDLYPMGSTLPYRIDLFDNEVDSIRTFDPETQRSIETIETINLLPAREFPLTEEAITKFRQEWRAKFTGNPLNAPIYQNISQAESAPGIEYYLPLFFENTVSLLNYFPENTLLIRINNLHEKMESYWQEINERYEQLRYDQFKPILPPTEIFLQTEQLFHEFKKFAQVEITKDHLLEKPINVNFSTQSLPDITIDRKLSKPLVKLDNFINNLPEKMRFLFTAESLGRREALLELFKAISLEPTQISNWQDFLSNEQHFAIAIGILETGVILSQENITIIPEAQLFGEIIQQKVRKQRSFDPELLIRDLTELQIGAPVVHLDHGIGLYRGLEIIKTGDIEAEYLMLEYANDAKLYVPVSQLQLISRYTGIDAENVTLHTLGSRQWEREKRKAAEKIHDVAAELLEIYSLRATKKGTQFSLSESDYQIFSNDFPFEETYDQQKAITEVLDDMTSTKIMDRLVCGDVGFGKTEVAMRAAFIAAQNGKQVAMLVPTTLLAEQHYQSFRDRFANWPFKVAVLSRFHADATQNKTLQEIADGKIDIVIGTHKLLQPNIKFKNLGVLIIDEEHRFGVRQKERIKALRSEVDILTLTATPIPRTLNMAMANIRDLSIIATPPARRLAIKTFIRDYNKALIREAILRETMRGGQVYFLHNDVATIERTVDMLQNLVPEARITFAHGQMPEKKLAQVMSDFYHQRFNVLVASTIIESGIDIPTANTIIIDRADRFGLAQLHQLRGRVGRSHHQAYAYLLIPNKKAITKDALKRLEAIESLEDLGAGFMLATHDLEIRGAGELLGAEQSGHIQTIGFTLYMELLDEAIHSLKSGKEFSLDKPFHQAVEIDLHFSALLPETYIPDVHTRLTLYKRIANAKNSDKLNDLQVELIDRFGLLPQSSKNLFQVAELKLKAEQLGIRKIDVGDKSGRIEFDKEPKIDLKKLINLIQTQGNKYKLDAQQKLHFTVSDKSPQGKMTAIEDLLQRLL